MYHSLTKWRLIVKCMFYMLLTKLVNKTELLVLIVFCYRWKELVTASWNLINVRFLHCENALFVRTYINYVNRKLKLSIESWIARTSFLVSTFFHFSYLCTYDLSRVYIMFLMRAALQTHYEGKWEVVGPWNSRVFWALWNGIEPIGDCHFTGPKKLKIVHIQSK
jgi:hypothetical protein